jgi:hypothetical protein
VQAPGPIWRTSVLSLFRVPGRSSSAGPTQQETKPGPSYSEKLSNERRGSDAYNYGFGVYALPSELLRQQSRSRDQVASGSPNRSQRPMVVTAPGPSPQFAGIGLRAYKGQHLAIRNNNQARNVRGPSFGSAQYRNAEQAPVPQSSRGGYVPPIFPHNVPQVTLPSRARDSNHPSVTNQSTVRHPQYPTPRVIPSSNTTTATLAPPLKAVPTHSPRTGIGMSMLRMSIDSILDAYGGTNNSVYRYGGSRTGEGVRLELESWFNNGTVTNFTTAIFRAGYETSSFS